VRSSPGLKVSWKYSRTRNGDERRTQIMIDHSEMTVEDLISDEDVVVTLSHAGYAKAQPLSDYTAQKRGGKGKSATSMKDEDFIDKLFVASMHDTVLFFGVVKKTSLADFSRPRANGIIAIDLRVDDQLINVALTDGGQDIMLISSSGRAMRFDESAVRKMGRTAAGVRGIRIAEGEAVISLIVVEEEGDILTATENGYGKRSQTTEYPTKGRGGKGVIDIKTTERNGDVVGAVQVQDNDEVMLITNSGTLIRTAVNGISTLGRNTQGVRLIRTSDEEKLVQVVRVVNEDDDEEDTAEGVQRDSDTSASDTSDTSDNGDTDESGNDTDDAETDSSDD